MYMWRTIGLCAKAVPLAVNILCCMFQRPTTASCAVQRSSGCFHWEQPDHIKLRKCMESALGKLTQIQRVVQNLCIGWQGAPVVAGSGRGSGRKSRSDRLVGRITTCALAFCTLGVLPHLLCRNR